MGRRSTNKAGIFLNTRRIKDAIRHITIPEGLGRVIALLAKTLGDETKSGPKRGNEAITSSEINKNEPKTNPNKAAKSLRTVGAWETNPNFQRKT